MITHRADQTTQTDLINTADQSTQTREKQSTADMDYISFKAEILGQQPNEFNKLLENKLQALLSKVDDENQNLFKGLKKARKECVKKICIRPKIENTDELDNRRGDANRTFTDVLNQSMQPLPAASTDVLSDDEETDSQGDRNHHPITAIPSPSAIQKASKGMRGIKKSSKMLHIFYKEEQTIIFPLLEELLLGLDSTLQAPTHQQGDDAKKFCIEIDWYTLTIIKFCGTFFRSKEYFPNYECVLLLAHILELCKMIVMGRNAIDWQQPNDLLDERGWTNWKNHLAALLTSLRMLATRCVRRWKKFRDFLTCLSKEFHLDNYLAELIYLLIA